MRATDDVSGVTVANIPTAQPITAGVFTVNGQQINVTTSESLDDVFSAISSATGGTVTGSYDSASDKIKLHSTSGNVIVSGHWTSATSWPCAAEDNGPTVTSSTALAPSAEIQDD